MINREEWLKHVARIEVLIESDGMYNALGAFLEALQNIEKDRGEEYGEEFYESQEYKNLQHCQQVIDCVMTACDLDIECSQSETRNAAMDQLKENISELETPELFKTQA